MKTVLQLAIAQLVISAHMIAQAEVPESAQLQSQLSTDDVKVYRQERTLWLIAQPPAVKKKRVVIPRLCAPIKSIHWTGQQESEIKFWPEVSEWVFSWKAPLNGSPTIKVVFDTDPVLPADCPIAVPAGDNSIMLQAYQASTFGEKLRFEPQWYKNTVGYWAVGTDYATWPLIVKEPGTYTVAVLQGCGKGHGGSDAVISLRQDDLVKAELPFKTIDTGHFQNFRWNHLGVIELSEAGTYQLRIDAKRIAKVALFDVRTIHLVKQANSSAN